MRQKRRYVIDKLHRRLLPLEAQLRPNIIGLDARRHKYFNLRIRTVHEGF